MTKYKHSVILAVLVTKGGTWSPFAGAANPERWAEERLAPGLPVTRAVERAL